MRLILRGGLACAVVSVLGWAGWEALGVLDARRLDATIAEAKEKIAAGSVREAHGLLTRAVGRRTGRGEPEFLLGACEQAMGRPEQAEAWWRRVPEGSPFAPNAAMLRARLRLQEDRFADAEPLLVAALRAEGRHAIEARETLVQLYKLQGRFDEARSLVLGAWGIYPDRAGLIREMEVLGSNNPMPVTVIREALEKAARNAPDDDRIWLGRAHVAIRTGRFDEADRWLERCSARRPDDSAVWKARLDLAMARQDEAAIEQALRELPEGRLGPMDVLALRAWFAARAGDDASERRAWEDVLAREPGSLKALERLADLALRGGDAREAAALRTRRAELNRIKARYEVQVAEAKPADHAELARSAEALGRWFEARSYWGLVLEREPANREARAAIARLRDLEAARPSGPTIRDLLAELDAMPRTNRPDRLDLPGDPPAFVDDAEAAGLRFAFDNGAGPLHHMPETTAGGVGLLDYDGDGWLDVYLTQAGPFPPDLDAPESTGDRLFRNRGDGTFEDVTDSAGLAPFARGYGHGVTAGDVDGDGHTDLFVTRWRRYALYRNRGDGTFEDATEAWGLGGDRDWPTSSAFADLDGDGDLDLYVCHYLRWDAENPSLCWYEAKGRYAYCAPQHSEALPDYLFRNDGGRFVDVSAEAGITAVDTDGRGLGVIAADLDEDGRVDLYVANDQSANFFFRNLGGMRFEDIAASSGLASNGEGTYQASMGIAAGDLDGDGRIDLAVTNFFNESTILYRNLGGGVFTDATAAVGLAAPSRYLLGFGAAFLDANNDGRLDLATANGHVDDYRPEIPWKMPTQLLLGTPDGRLVEATDRAGPPWRVERIGRGLAAGDLDNDGRPDLLVASHDGPLAYFHNRSEGGHWITFRLEGRDSNRDALGVRVVVTAGGVSRAAWRTGGGSFQSANDPRLHFGLGSATRVDRVEVTWPSDRVDRFGPLAADAAYHLREADPEAAPLPGYRTVAVARRPTPR